MFQELDGFEESLAEKEMCWFQGLQINVFLYEPLDGLLCGCPESVASVWCDYHLFTQDPEILV